jgi:5,5'-dehydrodivanillate O-demethylase
LKDETTGRWITSHTINQDFVGWVGQGGVADRTREHLGESDRGVILLRRRLLEEARKVEQGLDPKAIIRVAANDDCVPLPAAGVEAARTGRPFAEFAQMHARTVARTRRRLGELNWFAHQPEEVREEWVHAMGLEDLEASLVNGPAAAGAAAATAR